MIILKKNHRRLVVVLTVAMCAGVIGGIARTAILSDREQPSLSPKVWYRIDSSAGKAACQLPVNGGRYTLVIGCLADASESHALRLRFSDEPKRLSDVTPLEFRQRGSLGGPIDATPRDRRTSENSDRSHTTLVTEAVISKLVASLGATRDFYLHVTDGDLNDPKQYARVTAQCVAEGERIRVYVDQQLGINGVRDSQVADLIQLLETDVLPRVEAQYGSLFDADRDGRFAVVLSPWLGRLQGGRVSINGMVRSSDFQREVEQPLGNRCDMLLLNSSLPCGAALRDLLSHEVAHAACISQRVQHQKSVDEQDWVSEGLAHLAEPDWTNSAERIATFLDDPSRHQLVVPDYYRAGLWRDPGCRGATVLFSKWCFEKYGPGLCGRLAQSTKSGTQSFEQATSQPFEDLFRQWSVALAEGDKFQSLDLCGRVGGQQLAGIRRHHWVVETGDLSLPIRGTAIAVVELQSDVAHTTTICFEGDSTACWQYSIQRIPANGVASVPPVLWPMRCGEFTKGLTPPRSPESIQ